MIIKKPIQQIEIDRIDYLDGIRGWASFSVLMHHILMCFLVLSTPFLKYDKARIVADISAHNYLDVLFGIILSFICDGHLAVLIFFILSGYALSVKHLNLQKRNLALAATSRYFRLMIPILLTSLIAYALLKFELMFNLEVATSPEKSLGWLGSFYTFEANIIDVFSFSLFDVFFKYDANKTYNSSLWTMPTEIFGSFLIYIYLGIFRSTEKLYLKLVIVATIFLFIIKPWLSCFLIGYLFAELHQNYSDKNLFKILKTRAANLFFIAVFCISAVISIYFRDNDYQTCLLASSIVLSISLSSTLKSFFQNKYSHFLGRISFPLYLIHLPIICSWSSYIYIKLPTLGLEITTSNLINLFTTIILALISATILLPVEKFSIIYSKKIGNFLLR